MLSCSSESRGFAFIISFPTPINQSWGIWYCFWQHDSDQHSIGRWVTFSPTSDQVCQPFLFVCLFVCFFSWLQVRTILLKSVFQIQTKSMRKAWKNASFTSLWCFLSHSRTCSFSFYLLVLLTPHTITPESIYIVQVLLSFGSGFQQINIINRTLYKKVKPLLHYLHCSWMQRKEQYLSETGVHKREKKMELCGIWCILGSSQVSTLAYCVWPAFEVRK